MKERPPPALLAGAFPRTFTISLRLPARMAGMSPNRCHAPRRHSAALALAVLLSACGSGEEPAPADEVDPAVAGALADQILVDPQLVGQNDAGAVASLPSGEGGVPTLDTGPDAIARAREDALQLVGGPGAMRTAPAPRSVDGKLPADAALTAAARAAAAPGGDAACATRVQYTMAWAAQMLAAFPVYPRGAVQEAAGTDEGGCALRVINFQTPVPLQDIADFYYTRARAAGFTAERLLQAGDDVLAGTRGGASYVIYARRLPTGASEVDLVTSGS